VFRLLRAFSGFAALLLLSGLGLVVTTTPASATATLLCASYSGCAKAGMSNADYASANRTMYWRMYSGHNCTNYVAYRLVQSGLPDTRPWSGGGNASNWGPSNPEITNSVPAVGAVAWWAANVRPAGSAGHVAYVEQVISPDEIIVSQDSWGGDFSWARITRAGGSWPSGFIHFNDVKLVNTVKPTVAGTARVGQQLTATPGAWSQAGVALQYQWRADGVPIPGASGPSLTVDLAQQGTKIAVRVQAVKPGYSVARAFSPKTPTVAPGVISNTGLPMISGTPKVDSTLSASSGTWFPQPTTLTYQWTADGQPIDGATATTLTPGPDLVGKAIAVTVTAAKDGYVDVPAAAVATAPVAPGTITVTGAPTITGTPKLGQTLRLDTGRFTPADATVSVQWLRAGVPVEGGTGSTYELTAADLGSRISAVVTLTKAGYTTETPQAAPTGLVRTIPTMTVDTTSRNGRVRVVIRVTAPGVAPVTGTVVVSSHGKVAQQLTMTRGRVGTTLTGLRPGMRSFTVRFLQTDTVGHAALRKTVRIG
jgi:surface antigen